MDLGAILVGLALLIVTLPLVLSPFRTGGRRATPASAAGSSPSQQQAAVLAALRDLDFDFQIGKVSPEDYAGLRAQLVAEAAQHIQTQEAADDEIEALIRARRASRTKVFVCANCDGALATDDRFCSHCGAPVGGACPACGGNVQAGDAFCTACGARLRVESVAPA